MPALLKKTLSTTSFIKAFTFTFPLLLLSACNNQSNSPMSTDKTTTPIISAINHDQRPAKDKLRDERRKPAEILSLFEVQPGMTVLEILAGGGYYTELLSRIVGPGGQVYMQNTEKYYQFQTDLAVKQRLENNRLNNVIRWDKELHALDLPPEQLDAAFLMLVFHDFFWMTPSVKQVIDTLYSNIKPGGVVGLIDHAAVAGSGDRDAVDLKGKHRIDEQLVIEMFTRAGFVLTAASDVLRNKEDNRDAAFFEASMQNKATDRFVLKFIKPMDSKSNTAMVSNKQP
ncbi:class I SAM-dependent methyltransferase [Thalassomonas actiniarum]|uniref:Class I SAM-dependent methyltransferase n=1 Tax=Thalassomonas actiniarum TaxID=485447 RepID=A0AAE9YMA0_9GAMM|nr:class I SAM-dependent methyltransferase [Thalassomonas actiniarum]WDD97183.1 class I SAM-dependent methyltransferase [Thalassomonas actiniarum]